MRDYPNYDRNGRLQIFRGRALNAKGWALYKAGKFEDAATVLAEAVKAYGSLPEGRSALWHLATVKETAGDLNSAFESYLAGYEPPEAATADMKGAVIEVLFRKINGSADGLEERLRSAANTVNPDLNLILTSLAQRRQQPDVPKNSVTPNKRSLNRKTAKESLATASDSKLVKSVEPTVVTGQPVEAPPPEIKPVDSLKEEKAAPAAVPVVAIPVKLPEIGNSTSLVMLAPLFDPQLLFAENENVKPRPRLETEEEIPPAPPAPASTRPRRVLNPKINSSEQVPEAEPVRLRRPPKQIKPPLNF